MKPARRATSAAILAAVLSLFVTSTAAAFCRTRTCDPRREDCERDLAFCITSGDPLIWPSDCVSFSVQEDGSTRNQISAAELQAVATSAFQSWTEADCGNGVRPSIAIEPFDQVECGEPQYNQEHGNANIVLFRDDDWPEDNSGHALALTTVWFDPTSGRIYDADVEINGTGGNITITSPLDGADLQSILTHEFGHFLGLSHSEDADAVMRRFYDSGADDLRALRPDDVDGVCTIYPLGRVPQSDSCTPRHGFASDCASGVEGGCATRPGAASGASHAALFTAALAFAAARLRRRLRRS